MKESERTYKKHFLLVKSGGITSATTPKDWDRENREVFPNYDFSNSDNTPITEEIERYLVRNHNFKTI